MDELAIIKLLFNYGFPSALCFYVIHEVNKNIKSLTTVINTLGTRLEKLETLTTELSAKVNLLMRGENH